MLGDISKFGAVYAKVHAMFGHRLTAEEYKHLSSMKSVPEIADFLRSHPSWSTAVSFLGNTHDIHRGQLEYALRMQLIDESIRIFKFIPMEDSALMAFPFYLAELDAVMDAYRRLKQNVPSERVYDLPDFFKERSKIDYALLKNCSNYQEFLEAVKKSIYYAPLQNSVPRAAGALPEYSEVELLLQGTYFSAMYKTISKKYRGVIKSLLLKSVSNEVDLLNILHILRLKRYFNYSEQQIIPLLFSYGAKLKPKLINQLCTAQDIDAVFKVLRSSPYANLFTSNSFEYYEDYYYKIIYSFNLKLLMSGRPTICAPLAYINLKGIELKNLINVIESVRYGVSFENTSIQLIGV